MVIVTALFAALALGCNPLFPDFNNGFRLDSSDPGADGDDHAGPVIIETPGTGGESADYPTVIWPSGLTMYVGQALSAIPLTTAQNNHNTAGGTPGTFAWVTPTTVATVAGRHAFNVRFTPTDKVNYHTVTRLILITVMNQIEPAIRWPDGSFSGTAMNNLSSVSLAAAQTAHNNANGTPGTFSWDTPNTQMVKTTTNPTDSRPYTLKFTPTNSVMYRIVTIEVHINVSKAVITYSRNGGGTIGNVSVNRANPTATYSNFVGWFSQQITATHGNLMTSPYTNVSFSTIDSPFISWTFWYAPTDNVNYTNSSEFTIRTNINTLIAEYPAFSW